VCLNYTSLDAEMATFKYANVFGLFEMVAYPSVPFLFGSLASAGLGPCLRKSANSSMANNLLVVLGLLVMAGSVWLQAAWVVVSTEDAIR
jgi:hypothetical protein